VTNVVEEKLLIYPTLDQLKEINFIYLPCLEIKGEQREIEQLAWQEVSRSSA